MLKKYAGQYSKIYYFFFYKNRLCDITDIRDIVYLRDHCNMRYRSYIKLSIVAKRIIDDANIYFSFTNRVVTIDASARSLAVISPISHQYSLDGNADAQYLSSTIRTGWLSRQLVLYTRGFREAHVLSVLS